MSVPVGQPVDGNPFSTRHVRPGALPYLFPDGESINAVMERLAAAGWRGQIVGPHGSGKSTLLAALVPAFEASGRQVILVELHDGQRRLPVEVVCKVRACTHQKHTVHGSTHPTVMLVIDGYEQLPWWRRELLQRQCRHSEVGLLVTAHRGLGLPQILGTHVEPQLAQAIVSRLLDGWPALITPEEIDQCVHHHDQDLREALFELYDLFEQRRP